MMMSPAQQQERRRQLIAITVDIARRGGYDAVQMRAVADGADVAVGTVYRYFPSKQCLLLSALESELERVERVARPASSRAGDCYQQLWQVISHLNGGMTDDSRLAEAMARAFMLSYISGGADCDRVRRRLDAMFALPLGGGDEPTAAQRKLACLVVDSWVSNAISWLHRRATTADINDRLWHLLAVLARRDGLVGPMANQPDCFA